MTTSELLAACRELRDIRDQVRALRQRDEVLAADVTAELVRRRVDSIDFAPDRRAVLKRAVRYAVDDAALARAAAEAALGEVDLAACRRSDWDRGKLRALLGEDYAEVVTPDYGEPVLSIVALTPETRSASPVAD